jgi:hypothetical protein
MIKTEIVTVTVAGSAGSAVGNADSRRPLNGRLIAVYLDYVTQAATADVTITTKKAPVKTLLTVTDSATDGWYYPRYVVHSEAAAALTGTSGGDRTEHPLDDYINVAVAQSDAGSVIAYFLYEALGE